MRSTLSLAIWALAIVTVHSTPDVSLLPPGNSFTSILRGQCTECKKPTSCKSELVINEVEVSKDVNIPTVDTKEKTVYKQIPVPDYEIKDKITTKVVRVPAQTVTFQKTYRDSQPALKQRVRKPLIKYNITWIDVEVERLVVHEKPVNVDFPVDKVKYIPETINRVEPIFVTKRRPVGVPKSQPKEVTVPNGIRTTKKQVAKKVVVPEITYRYCDTVKNIYVPDKCDVDNKGADGSSSVNFRSNNGVSGTSVFADTSATAFTGSSSSGGFATSSANAHAEASASAFSDSFQNQFVSNLQPPSLDSGRFVRQPAPAPAPAPVPVPVQQEPAPNPVVIETNNGVPNLFSASRFFG